LRSSKWGDIWANALSHSGKMVLPANIVDILDIRFLEGRKTFDPLESNHKIL
jgi:hypothetical protein